MFGLTDQYIQNLGKKSGLLLHLLLGAEAALVMELAAACEKQIRRGRFLNFLLANLRAPAGRGEA